MKILQEGNPRKHEIKRFRCLNCDCIFEADKGEYQTKKYPPYGFTHSCKCPCCGEEVIEHEEL